MPSLHFTESHHLPRDVLPSHRNRWSNHEFLPRYSAHSRGSADRYVIQPSGCAFSGPYDSDAVRSIKFMHRYLNDLIHLPRIDNPSGSEFSIRSPQINLYSRRIVIRQNRKQSIFARNSFPSHSSRPSALTVHSRNFRQRNRMQFCRLASTQIESSTMWALDLHRDSEMEILDTLFSASSLLRNKRNWMWVESPLMNDAKGIAFRKLVNILNDVRSR